MNNKDNTKVAYNVIAKRYYEKYKDDTTDLEYIDNFFKQCRHKILDLGCGMGHYTKYIKSKGFDVCGIDFSNEMLSIAKKSDLNIKYILSDICNLPLDLDKDYDGVLLAYVIHHLSKEETRQVLLQLHNYITDNCNLLIFLREGNGILKEKEPFDTRFEYTIKSYTKEEIIILMNECGYEIVKIDIKPPADDDYSLSPNTLVLYAKKKKINFINDNR